MTSNSGHMLYKKKKLFQVRGKGCYRWRVVSSKELIVLGKGVTILYFIYIKTLGYL